MKSIEKAKQKIRAVIAKSKVPEDPHHAENTLDWLLRLAPDADDALQIAALAHDIERAIETQKIQRSDFNDYDAFKAAHAANSADILKKILSECRVADEIIEEACRLVTVHEVGGDARSDLLNDADCISYFDVNMPLYYQREGWEGTKRRSIWGYRRGSKRIKEKIKQLTYEDEKLTQLLREAIQQSDATG